MTLSPVGRYVLVERVAKAEISPGGIVLSAAAASDLSLGKVVKVGYGEFEHGVFIKPDFAEGELVLYSPVREISIPYTSQVFIHSTAVVSRVKEK